MKRMRGIDWTEKLETAILECIESGDPLRRAAAKNGISDSAIIRHVQDDAEFAKRYARAKEIQLEHLADEILTIADSADNDSCQVARLQVDSRKWLLSKLVPKKYGDKVEQFVSGPSGGPIQHTIEVEFIKTGGSEQSQDSDT